MQSRDDDNPFQCKQMTADELFSFFSSLPSNEKKPIPPEVSDEVTRKKIESFFVEHLDLSELKKLFPDREITSLRVKLSRKPDLIYPNKGVMQREHFSVKFKFKDHASETIHCQ